MDNKKLLKSVGILIPALLIILKLNVFADIINDVKKLHIGIEGYYIGDTFNKKNLLKLKKAFHNTEKYQDKDLVITISQKDRVIIGLYKKFDNVTFEKLKKTVSFLMMRFGEPTIEAHDKSIYWFYSKKGKITNKDFLKMKKDGNIEKPLLMVKFQSKEFLSKIDKKKGKTDFYYIIYSGPLINSLVKK